MNRLPRPAAGALAAALCLAASMGAGTSAEALASRAGTAHSGRTETVTSGAARSLGEPAAAQDAHAAAVTATVFDPTGAQAAVWTQRSGQKTWSRAGSILPAGFGTSYDPAASAAPGGPLLVVAGAAPPGENCTANGSVAIASVDSKGRLGAVRLVNDQRGTGSFDDRPEVAVGQHGDVWVAWSQGPDSDACQDVGYGDRIEVAVSHDGGQTFGTPVEMPAEGGHSAFGVRLAPLPGGKVAVSWTETMAAGDQAVLVTVLGANGQAGQPAQALTGDGPPLALPGASFYDFPAGDIAALPGGRLAVAAPFWVSGESEIRLAVGTPGGQWRETDLRPPPGADLLLPALGLLSPGDLRLVCAVHTRAGDRLGYDRADFRVTGKHATPAPAGLTALTPAPAGPGFYEIGEEISLTRTPTGLLSAVVVAGKTGATLESAAFTSPPPPARPAKTASPPSRTPAASGRAAAGGTTRASAPGAGFFSTTALLATLVIVAVLGCIAIVLGARARSQRAQRRRVPAWQAAQYDPAGRQARYQPGRWAENQRAPRPPDRWQDNQRAPRQPERWPERPDRRQPPPPPPGRRPETWQPQPPGRWPDGRPVPPPPHSGQDSQRARQRPDRWPDGRQPPRQPDGWQAR